MRITHAFGWFGLISLCLQGCVTVAHQDRAGVATDVDLTQALRATLKDTQTGPDAPRVLVDLAEAYLEEARRLALKSMDHSQPIDEMEMRYLAEQAAAAYGTLARTYPTWPMRPRALHYLGTLLRQLGDAEAAHRWWSLLVEKYRDSDESAKIRLLWSRDWAKAGGQPTRAIESLKDVRTREDSIGAQAHYWTAWAYRTLGKDTLSLSHFEHAARLSQADAGEVHREALLDSVILYNTVHPDRSGLSFYGPLSADRGVYLDVLNRLEQRYGNIDAVRLALPVNRELLRLSDDVDRMDARVVRLYEWHTSSEYAYLEPSDLELVRRAWRHLEREGLDEETQAYYGDLAFDLCMRLDVGDTSSSGLASAWRVFVDEWPQHTQQKKGLLNLARAYDASKRPTQAAETWAQLAKSDLEIEGLGTHREAIARYLLAYEQTNEAAGQWLALSGMMRHLKGARLNASESVQGTLMYRVARAHQQSGAHERAYSLYERVIKETPRVQQALGSAQAMLAIRNAQRDPLALVAALDMIGQQPIAQNPVMAREVARLQPLIEGQVRAERVAQARQEGRNGFKTLLNQATSGSEKAEVHAAIAMHSRAKGDFAAARESFDEIRRLDPRAESLSIVATQLASDAMARGQVSEVARIYLDTLKSQPHRMDTFGPALADLLGHLNQPEQALKVWRKVSASMPHDANAKEQVVWWSLQTQGVQATRGLIHAFLERGGQSRRLSATVHKHQLDAVAKQFARTGTPSTAAEFTHKTKAFLGLRGAAETYLSVCDESGVLDTMALLVDAAKEMSDAARGLKSPAGLSPSQVTTFRGMLDSNAVELEGVGQGWREQCMDVARQHVMWTAAALSCKGTAEQPVVLKVGFQSTVSQKSLLASLLENAGDEALLLQRVSVYARDGRLGAAQLLVDWVVDRSPESAEARRLQGDVLWVSGHWADASHAYQVARDLGSSEAGRRLKTLGRGDDGQAGL